MSGGVLDPIADEEEQNLLARAAWLYFAGGMTHS